MQVISKQTLIFRVPGQKNYVLHPTKHPVSAPESLRSTPLFKLAISDGTVQEFVPVAVPVTVPVDPSKDDKAKSDADAKDKNTKAK
jgi:hypothetical protein